MSMNLLNAKEKIYEAPIKRWVKRAATEYKLERQLQGKEIDSTLAKRLKVEAKIYLDADLARLNPDDWRIIFQYLSENEIVVLCSVSKQFQQIVQQTKSGFKLSRHYQLDARCFLNYALSKSCTSIDINYCSWLTPSTIYEMISKTNLQHLHLVQCQMDQRCVRAICNLPLRSLSITYTRELRLYFSENIKKSLPFSRTLTRLEMNCIGSICSFLNFDASTFIFEMYMGVLQHCKELQHLKLFSDSFQGSRDHVIEPYNFPSISPFLKKLTSLEFDIEYPECALDFVKFLKAILRDKVVPLRKVDFGQSTCDLLEDGILFHPLILPQAKLILRNYSIYSNVYFGYESYQEKICKWMNQTTYETIFVENVHFKDFAPFAKKIVSSSGQSIKAVYFRNCLINNNLKEGIGLFTINCPQITTLHLIKIRSTNAYPHNYEQMARNESILENLSNLTSLKVFVISSDYLNCQYTNHQGSELIKIMPFWKVTRGCQQLIEIRLTHPENFATIHVDSICAIAHCKNLRVLEMSRFEIRANKDVEIANIIKNCAKLEQLSICLSSCRSFQLLESTRQISYIFGNCLSYTKDLKILKINCPKRFLTETFLKCLCFCDKLEKINFRVYQRFDELKSDMNNLIKVLPKLKNLFVFKIQFFQSDAVISSQLHSLFEKIRKEKPAFSGSVL